MQPQRISVLSCAFCFAGLVFGVKHKNDVARRERSVLTQDFVLFSV